MGRRSKNKNSKRKSHFQSNHQQRNNTNRKRQKRERFWIEDCAETKISKEKSYQLEVLITRVELVDDYQQTPGPTGKKEEQNSIPTLALKAERPASRNDGDEDYNEKQSKDMETKIVKASTQTNDESKKLDETGLHANPTDEITAEEGHNEIFSGSTEQTERAKNEVINNPEEPGSSANPVLKSAEILASSLLCIRRSKSAKRPITKVVDSVENFKPLPNGDCGDGVTNPFSNEEVPDKFWSQRRRLFSRFDEGVQLDKEAWYSVTPEAIANHIAAHLASGRKNLKILDPFCGCGGNAIAFALRKEVDLVVCVDRDNEKLKMAAVNAKIYGIPTEKLLFINDNACRVFSMYHHGNLVKSAQSICAGKVVDDLKYAIGGLDLLPGELDVAFLSPPWGGMDYCKVGKRNYDLSCISLDGVDGKKINGEELLEIAAGAVGHKPVAIFLPRNINGVALGKAALKAGYKGPLIMEQNVLNGKLKTVTAYLGHDAE